MVKRTTPKVSGKANALSKMPSQAKAYGVRGTKPPSPPTAKPKKR